MSGLITSMLNTEKYFMVRLKVLEHEGIKKGYVEGVFESMSQAMIRDIPWDIGFGETSNKTILWTKPKETPEGLTWYVIEKVYADTEEEALIKIEDQAFWKDSPLD